MNIFNVFRRRSEPRNSVNTEVQNLTLDSEALRQAIADANNVGSVRVSERSVMALPAAWRAVTIISQIIAGFPFSVLREQGDERSEVPSHPIAIALTRRANERMSGFEFRRVMQTHLCLRGDAFARIVRPLRPNGPWEFLPLDLDTVTPKLVDNRRRVEYEIQGPRGRRQTLPASEVFHLRGVSLDGVNGLSPVQVARMNFAIALEGQKGAQKLLRNGSFAGFGLKHPGKLSDKAQKNIQDSYEEKYGGTDNAGRPPIFEEGMEPIPLGFTATDAQFLEGRRFSLGDIARMFGVPSHLLNDTERSTSWGTGISQLTQGFVDYTLMEWVRIWESAVDFQLLDDEALLAKVDTDALERGDPKTRADFYTKMRLIGVYNANEIRKFEGKKAREDEGGDEYLTPSGAMLSPMRDNEGGNNEGS